MSLRQALFAAILASGTAATAAAQAEEFPFRRFAFRNRAVPRLDIRPYRFSIGGSDRIPANVERLRFRLQERNHDLANRVRLGEFSSPDLTMRLRNRDFAMRDDARRRQMEFRFRDMDRIRDRIRDRMDHFRFERPLIMRRHSRTI